VRFGRWGLGEQIAVGLMLTNPRRNNVRKKKKKKNVQMSFTD
jgi:hypothetical protein